MSGEAFTPEQEARIREILAEVFHGRVRAWDFTGAAVTQATATAIASATRVVPARSGLEAGDPVRSLIREELEAFVAWTRFDAKADDGAHDEAVRRYFRRELGPQMDAYLQRKAARRE